VHVPLRISGGFASRFLRGVILPIRAILVNISRDSRFDNLLQSYFFFNDPLYSLSEKRTGDNHCAPFGFSDRLRAGCLVAYLQPLSTRGKLGNVASSTDIIRVRAGPGSRQEDPETDGNAKPER
jgi:hypothetical protein